MIQRQKTQKRRKNLCVVQQGIYFTKFKNKNKAHTHEEILSQNEETATTTKKW